MPRTPYDAASALVDSGIDLTEPFTTATARRHGLTSRSLGRIVSAGLLRRTLAGVYHAGSLRDCLELRLACLRLVVPEGCVVTDRTAGWLHGASMVLAPDSHIVVPTVEVFHQPGKRLRNALTSSGERGLTERDVVELGGVLLTTPLRTACDLGRLLHRDSGFAALDAMLRLGAFSRDELILEVDRFRGYRGVRQLRAFAPLSDPGSESFGESVLRLRWYDACLGVRPETQIRVLRPGTAQRAFLDLGSETWRYAAEYDGAQFHGSRHETQDARRRAWISEAGWVVDVFRKEHVFGRHQNAEQRLRAGLGRAKVHFCAGSAY